MNLSIIIPCLNEEVNLPVVYQKVSEVLSAYENYEIIFVDDGSTDGSLHLIKSYAEKDERVKYVSFTKNFGYEIAFRVGFEAAKYDWCIQYDADMQSPPEEIHKLIKKAQEGYDVVFGKRKNRDDPFYRIAGSKLHQLIAKKIFKIDMPIGSSSFRIINRYIARQIIYYPTRAPYFIATVPLVTSNYTLVETLHAARKSGKSKFKLRHLLAQTFDLFFGFSTVPLNFFWSWLVFGLLCLGGLMIKDLERITFLKAILISIFAILQFFSFSIIGAYIKRPKTSIPHHHYAVKRETNIPGYNIGRNDKE